ncbi:MAG: universal stress protein [Dehalococcoidales bacterium]|nr:universal stress protein [Dehalococcoidales bacterium]
MDFKRILVPAGGGGADEGAMELACRLAKKDKGQIWAVYVITVKRALPIDAEIEPEIATAEKILDHIEEIAENQDCEIETDVLQAREAGPAIIDEAVEKQADVIIMGVSQKKRFGQFSIGNIVPYILKSAPCPVILLQQ